MLIKHYNQAVFEFQCGPDEWSRNRIWILFQNRPKCFGSDDCDDDMSKTKMT